MPSSLCVYVDRALAVFVAKATLSLASGVLPPDDVARESAYVAAPVSSLAWSLNLMDMFLPYLYYRVLGQGVFPPDFSSH